MLQSFPLVRLAALDLDGTLLNRNNEVTLATRQAIARAVEHGVVVVPATGRPLASLPPVVAKLPGIRYAITSNGAAVWDLGDDPMGAVHSRYANAAQRHTSEPACLLHRLTVWIRAVPCWLWPTCWASPTRTPLPWATARTTAPCWKRQGSPLLWPTECPRSRPLAAL